jgi:hypothetical protein
MALFEPSRCRFQKFPGDGTIGEAFEEAEETGLFIMECDMVAVDDRRDPADRFSVLARKETGGFGVLKKGVLLVVKEEFYFALERRDPVGASLVHFPRESDKFVDAGRTYDLFDVHDLPLLDYEITPSFLPAFSITPSTRSSISSVWVAM